MQPEGWIECRIRNHAHVTRPIICSLPLTPNSSMDGIMDPLNAPILPGSTLQPCLVAEGAVFAVSRHQESQALSQVTAGILIRNLDGSADQVILGLRSLPKRPADRPLPGCHLNARLAMVSTGFHHAPGV